MDRCFFAENFIFENGASDYFYFHVGKFKNAEKKNMSWADYILFTKL